MINKPKGSPGKLLMPLPHQHRSGFQLRFSTIATALVIRLYAAAVSMVEKASPNQLISSFLTVSLRAMIRGVPLKSSGCTQDFPAKAESFLTSTPHCSLTGILINLYLLISAGSSLFVTVHSNPFSYIVYISTPDAIPAAGFQNRFSSSSRLPESFALICPINFSAARPNGCCRFHARTQAEVSSGLSGRYVIFV